MKPFSKALSSRTISAYPWTVNFPRRYQHVRERSTFIPFWTSSRFWKALRLKITKPVSPKLKRMSKSFLLVKLFHVIWVQRIFYSKEKRLGRFRHATIIFTSEPIGLQLPPIPWYFPSLESLPLSYPSTVHRTRAFLRFGSRHGQTTLPFLPKLAKLP